MEKGFIANKNFKNFNQTRETCLYYQLLQFKIEEDPNIHVSIKKTKRNLEIGKM